MNFPSVLDALTAHATDTMQRKVIDGQSVLAMYVNVTPELAEWLLAEHNSVNRNLSGPLVAQLADDMIEGQFRFNGETVKISSAEQIVDGQNRLQAIANSGISQEILIVYGLWPDVIETIDQGKPRSVADILTIKGLDIGNMTIVVSMATIRMLGSEPLHVAGRSRIKVAEYTEKHLDTLEPMAAWGKHVSLESENVRIRQYSNDRRSLSPSPTAALALTMIELGGNPDDVTAFLEAVATGMTTDTNEFGSYRVLRKWLAEKHPLIREGGTQFPRMMSVYSAMITTFNRIQRGQPVHSIRLPKESPRFFDQLPKPVANQ